MRLRRWEVDGLKPGEAVEALSEAIVYHPRSSGMPVERQTIAQRWDLLSALMARSADPYRSTNIPIWIGALQAPHAASHRSEGRWLAALSSVVHATW